jgi:hypothetical protein
MNNELYPFIKGIENKVDSIMIGHLAVPALNDGKNTSATLSKNIIENLLRNQLGFEGLVISDALNMKSVSDLYQTKGQLEWEAFNAGNDILCFAENVTEGIQAILNNATTERIEESFARIWKYKEKVGILSDNNQFPDETNASLNFTISTELNRKIAESCLTKVKSDSIPFRIQQADKNNSVAQLSIYKDSFATKVLPSLQAPIFSITAENPIDFKETLNKYDTLLISLFVPKAKPLNHFEIKTNVLQYLGELLATKNCVLYVFGNPYALQVIPNLALAKEIVMAYQDFDVFQEVAAQQFIHNSACKGQLPVKIKNL